MSGILVTGIIIIIPEQLVPMKPVPVQLQVKLSGAEFSIQLPPFSQGGGSVKQISLNTQEQSVSLVNSNPGSHDVELSPQAI